MAKRYYWLKLKKDFFDQKIIKKLRRLAGGDTFTIIYLKLQLLSLKDNGKLYHEGIEDNLIEELALELDEELDNVKLTINFLQMHGLIEQVSADEFTLPETLHLIGSEADSTHRVRKYREKQKALHCNTNVTLCNTEKEIDIELEKELDLEEEKTIVKTSFDYQAILEKYHLICKSLPKVVKLTDKRRKAIKGIVKEYEEVLLETAFFKVEQSDFLTGRSGSWKCNFDWIMNKNNFIKIIEGNYDNKQSNNAMDRLRENGGYNEQTIL